MTRDPQKQAQLPASSLGVGRYANVFNIGHNAFEFVFEFAQQLSEQQEPVVHTRIITHPIYAKALHRALGDSLDRYEGLLGEIDGTEERSP